MVDPIRWEFFLVGDASLISLEAEVEEDLYEGLFED